MKCKFLLVLVMICANSFAQYTYPKTSLAKNVLASTLVVQLLDGDNEVVSRRNDDIIAVFRDHWKHTDLLFLTQSQIDSLAEKHKNGYSYVFQDDFEYNETRNRHINSDGSIHPFGDGMGGRLSYNAFTFGYYSCYLNARIDGDYEFITSIGFANDNLRKTDYLFLYQQLSRLLDAAAQEKPTKEYFNVNRNIETLPSKTLVLPKHFFKEKDYGKISKYYDHSYELVDIEVYEQTILNREVEKAYVKIIWSHQHKLYMWVVVNAEDGAILAITGFGGVSFGSYHTANEIIKAKHLKYTTSKFAQKINNRYGG
ncbi:hypothetical protein J8281_11630 [Aquimarina sp. U1-2]|uniref:hypothetical protein n=1 Tax=Aquimarina sp. U1-2 TaxID=2823141 RepID=UPI001AECED19|nr:hypothetical protein [Aquimarina sp. U1-2]MBP2832837.1 hypothetical protein [Aquimarina sp. U1-2]